MPLPYCCSRPGAARYRTPAALGVDQLVAHGNPDRRNRVHFSCLPSDLAGQHRPRDVKSIRPVEIEYFGDCGDVAQFCGDPAVPSKVLLGYTLRMVTVVRMGLGPVGSRYATVALPLF